MLLNSLTVPLSLGESAGLDSAVLTVDMWPFRAGLTDC